MHAITGNLSGTLSGNSRHPLPVLSPVAPRPSPTAPPLHGNHPQAGEVTTEAESVAAELQADVVSTAIYRRDVPSRETPLHLAVRLRDSVSVNILMAAGADWSLQNEHGWSARALQEAIYMSLALFDGFCIERADQTFLFLGEGFSSDDGNICLPSGSPTFLAHKEKERNHECSGGSWGSADGGEVAHEATTEDRDGRKLEGKGLWYAPGAMTDNELFAAENGKRI
ncbi:hypothetical protein HHK36_020053 [Tetracentron sinense]|uniref:Ankyrin repeat domain-containing protein n=1 Tax=Tetracentron sinense TaxID=13715 RepID=A0A834YUU3_TETSI|nr:hypothetical protein HHK36_020053 [Tetracentron sinense]